MDRPVIDLSEDAYAPLRNDHKAPVEYGGAVYESADAAYRAEAVKIPPDLPACLDCIMYGAVRAKFKKDPTLAEALLATGDAVLTMPDTGHIDEDADRALLIHALTDIREELSLVREIRKTEQEGRLAVTEETENSISTDDFDEDTVITYRLARPDRNWYADRIKYVSRKTEDLGGHLKSRLAELLVSLDPAMTRTLSAVYLVACQEDLPVMAEEAGAEEYEVPDCIDPDSPNGALGCLWWAYSSVILDLKRINEAAASVVEDAARDGAFMDLSTECDIGAYVTLTHEIYHLAQADPFMDGLPDGEDAAEQYGREAYETWKYGGH